MRCPDPGEHTTVQHRSRSAIPQVARDGLAYISGQRERIEAVSLPPDRDLAASPVDVVQAQPGDLGHRLIQRPADQTLHMP